MAGATQGGRASGKACGSLSGPCHTLRHRTVRRDPIRRPTLGIEAVPINVRDADEIKRTLSAFARSGSGGLVVIPSPASFLHRDLVVALAAQFKLPAIYFLRLFVTAGGLISYGPDE